MRVTLRTAAAAIVAAAATAAAFPSSAAAECEPIMPTASVTAGMTGTGWTVASGRTKEPFDVEVLGVLRDAIGPGRDIIVVEASSPTIDRVGIWAGMSGSPVYVGGELIGALAYGFAWGPSRIAGLTPAEDIAAVANLPVTAAIRRLDAAPRSVRLPAALARTVAARAGVSVQAASGLKQLEVPLSVSGLGRRAMERLTADLRERGAPLLPVAGRSASRSASTFGTVEAGDNFAAALTRGDVTLAGIGTASYVCDGTAVAFGHPFTFSGATTMAANAADAVTVVDDAFVSYKLANVAEPLGLLDQDRLGGIRTRLGDSPTAIPIESRVKVPGLGRSRIGVTDVFTTDWAGLATIYHLLSTYDSEYDAIGKGTATTWWMFEGTRADGRPWRLVRRDLFTSSWDITFRAALEVGFQLEELVFNPWEDIEVTQVYAATTFDTALRTRRLSRVEVSKNGGPFRAVRRVSARPGTRLVVKAFLQPRDSSPITVVELPFRIPRSAFPMGFLTVGGPEGRFEGDGEDGPGGEEASFDDLLELLQTVQSNDVLAGRLVLASPPRGELQQRGRRQVRLDSAVVGARTIEIVPERRRARPPRPVDR